MNYPCSENKGADQLRGYVFVFAYTDCWFSDAAAHLLVKLWVGKKLLMTDLHFRIFLTGQRFGKCKQMFVLDLLYLKFY